MTQNMYKSYINCVSIQKRQGKHREKSVGIQKRMGRAGTIVKGSKLNSVSTSFWTPRESLLNMRFNIGDKLSLVRTRRNPKISVSLDKTLLSIGKHLKLQKDYNQEMPFPKLESLQSSNRVKSAGTSTRYRKKLNIPTEEKILKIQQVFRRYLARRKYNSIKQRETLRERKRSPIAQEDPRGSLPRRNSLDHSAILIQKHVRSSQCRTLYKGIREAAILIQSHFRKHLSVKVPN